MTPPTAAPTKAPTAAPMTAAPMTAAPTTAAPTTAAPKPTPPPPPRATESTLQPVSHIAELAPAADPVTESAIVVPIIASAGGAIILSLLLWRYCKGKEVVLNTDGDFHALPDIEYTK